MSGKYALIIGNTEYIDSGLAQLSAPGKDAEDFAQVLKDQEIGAFDSVNILLNQSSAAVTEAIDEFFDQKRQDDLLVLYFSGHGVRDELGTLYLAVKNTIRTRLRSTAVKSDFIREAMDQCRSNRQVLILDCCNSGAFAQGTKAATGVSIGTATAFESGFGRIILTASDSTQFAWEGDKVIGETDNSLFTHYLVEGLKGDADNDGDGRITVDELYDYTYEKVRRATPKQTPSKFSTKQQGEIVLRQRTRIEHIKPIPLPDDLIAAAKSSLPYVREAAVRQLDELLKGANLGLARSAREILEHIAENDDSKTISRAAFQALEAIRQTEQVALRKIEEERLAKLEAEHVVEEKRQVLKQAEAEQKAKAEAERLGAAQKAEEERIAKAKLAAERLAKEKRLAEEAEQERKAKAEAQHLATQKANEERIAREKTEADRKAQGLALQREQSVAQKTQQDRAGLVKGKEAVASPLASTEIARSGTLISQRALYSIIVLVLIGGLVFIGRNIAQRSVTPETTLSPSVTEDAAKTFTTTSSIVLQPPLTTATVLATASRTPSPSATKSLTTTVYVTVSKAYLYKGPDLSFGLAAQIAYPTGTKFTVLARNLSGRWLFCQAADGNQGWLYQDWLNVAFDPMVIPTASFIPTIAPKPTKPKNDGGGGAPQPTPTCVFC